MSTAFYVGHDNVSTTTTGYTSGASSLALAPGGGAQFGSSFPILVSTFLADGTPKWVAIFTGRTTDSLTGKTVVSGADADLPPGSVVAMRWTAEHMAQVAAAVNAIEVTAAGLGSASTHPASDFDAAGAASAVNSSLAAHVADTTNPHAVTKSQVGLGNCDNTSDANKPVSTATATALALKAPLASPTLTGTPTAPTAANGTNTTQVATTAFVLANAGSGGSPGGADTQIQFNNAGAFAGSAGLTFDGTTFKTNTINPAAGTLLIQGGSGDFLNLYPGSGGVVQTQTLRVAYVNPATTPFGVSHFGPGTATSDVAFFFDASNGFNRIAIDQNFTLTWRGKSSTQERDQGRVTSAFGASTDASRTGRVSLLACDFTGTDREGIRVESDGTQALVGFYGHAAVAKAPTPTTLADVIALLQALGLCN